MHAIHAGQANGVTRAQAPAGSALRVRDVIVAMVDSYSGAAAASTTKRAMTSGMTAQD